MVLQASLLLFANCALKVTFGLSKSLKCHKSWKLQQASCLLWPSTPTWIQRKQVSRSSASFSCPTTGDLLCIMNTLCNYLAQRDCSHLSFHHFLTLPFSLSAALCRNAQMGIIGTLRLSTAKVKISILPSLISTHHLILMYSNNSDHPVANLVLTATLSA